jgi:hypothetical protein
MECRKKAISIRMSASDVSKIKRLAKRFGVRDSDVVRFAVKSALAKLAPLQDATVRGRNLVPVFVESGAELFHHFDLDVARLENIINEDAEDERRVDHEDIQLIAMSVHQGSYLRWQLKRPPLPGGAASNAGAGLGDPPLNGNAADALPEQVAIPAPSLRDYLYEKYVVGNRGDA